MSTPFRNRHHDRQSPVPARRMNACARDRTSSVNEAKRCAQHCLVTTEVRSTSSRAGESLRQMWGPIWPLVSNSSEMESTASTTIGVVVTPSAIHDAAQAFDVHPHQTGRAPRRARWLPGALQRPGAECRWRRRARRIREASGRGLKSKAIDCWQAERRGSSSAQRSSGWHQADESGCRSHLPPAPESADRAWTTLTADTALRTEPCPRIRGSDREGGVSVLIEARGACVPPADFDDGCQAWCCAVSRSTRRISSELATSVANRAARVTPCRHLHCGDPRRRCLRPFGDCITGHPLPILNQARPR